MDDLFGPGSFLGGILKLNQGSPASFGALGSGGTGVGSDAGVNNGMPMSGVGPGPTANITPAQAQGSPGILGQLANRLGLGAPGGAPGSAPAGNNAAAPAGPTFAQKAAGLGQQYLKNANQPLKPATFAPMQLQGPVPQNMNLV